MIAGGGIGDGPIDGVVNLYVIDDDTRAPISGAEVRVGDVAGTTDADGLFVAEGVVGPQDILVKASGHRKELWLGANGANVTIDLEVDNAGDPPSATLTGTILNYDAVPFTPAANHAKVALITYSQTDELGDAANNIATPAPGVGQLAPNICINEPCNFTVNTRTGRLALIATILDYDSKGTPEDTDDTTTVIGYAIKRGIDTASATGSQDLTVLAPADTQTIAVAYDTPPSTLANHAALIGIELGAEGVLPVATLTTTPSVLVPKVSALTGATGYRLTAFASDGATPVAQSIALRRGLAGPTLAAGSWLAPPTGLSLTKQGGSWSNANGATIHGIELSQGATRLVNISVFDGRTSFELPSLVTLPSGPIDAAVNAIGATDFDLTEFSLDDDRDKIDRVGSQQTTIN